MERPGERACSEPCRAGWRITKAAAGESACCSFVLRGSLPAVLVAPLLGMGMLGPLLGPRVAGWSFLVGCPRMWRPCQLQPS